MIDRKLLIPASTMMPEKGFALMAVSRGGRDVYVPALVKNGAWTDTTTNEPFTEPLIGWKGFDQKEWEQFYGQTVKP